MRSSTLIIRSLSFYRRTHLGVLLGTALATGILVGAFVVGDSLRFSLRQMTLARLGRVEFALTTPERFFRKELAVALSRDCGAPCAPLLHLQGIGIAEGGRARLNQVQVLVVDEGFWALSRERLPYSLGPDEVAVNERLAARLDVRAGSTLLLRVRKVRAVPADMPLTAAGDASVALPLTVKAIVPPGRFGDFSLSPSQVPPANAFVCLEWFSNMLELPGKANAMLVGDSGPPLREESLAAALRRSWTLADAGLEIRTLPQRTAMVELRSDRIFLEPSVTDAALAIPGAQGILTYFVKHIRAGERSTPYSFVAAIDGPPVRPDMPAESIVLTDWLATDLSASDGDSVELEYWVPSPSGSLTTQSRTLRVHGVTPLDARTTDPTLMPAFPGLSDAGSCRDWDPGIPINLDKIRPKDEQYWEQHRGTPKAFVPLRTGQTLWQNRFGSLTAVRYPAGDQTPDMLRSELRRRLDPRTLGFMFRPVREEGLRAGAESVDFAQLFIGLSFFLIVASLLLTSLLFVFGVEQRAAETGTLLALGFRPGHVRLLHFSEAVVLAIGGGLLGIAGALGYTTVIMHALTSVWRDAVGTPSLVLHVRLPALLTGTGVGIVAALAVLALALRRLGQQSVTALQRSAASMSTEDSRRRTWKVPLAVLLCVAGTVIILARSDPGRGKAAAATFFLAGCLMLVATVGLCDLGLRWLRRVGADATVRRHGLLRLSVRNCVRHRGRSLATIALLACGVFLVVAVSANRHDPRLARHGRTSGTGGFALFCESTLPILKDLNTPAGQRAMGLQPEQLDSVTFVHIAVHPGDDASCLNLNRVRQPHLLGVPVRELAARQAFTVVELTPEVDPQNPWSALEMATKTGDTATIPGIADHSMIVWGLGKNVGDTVSYTDDSGREFEVKLVAGIANSILQGGILISDTRLRQRFPSAAGSRMLLVDGPSTQAQALAAMLSKALQDVGLEAVPASVRLAEFSAVENTYLRIFLMLGGLGVALGTVGLGVVVLRNVLERRSELALLRALGFSRVQVVLSLLAEHATLLAAGLAGGAVAALVAVLPAAVAPGGQIPAVSLTILLAGLAANGMLWVLAAAAVATAGNLIPALRAE